MKRRGHHEVGPGFPRCCSRRAGVRGRPAGGYVTRKPGGQTPVCAQAGRPRPPRRAHSPEPRPNRSDGLSARGPPTPPPPPPKGARSPQGSPLPPLPPPLTRSCHIVENVTALCARPRSPPPAPAIGRGAASSAYWGGGACECRASIGHGVRRSLYIRRTWNSMFHDSVPQ
ncbi:unnamed protein product [Rangifer tarandus platyrhynchus]|uniref:Uncharacterized protein n=1 Tax=Rangifer tarandus platyrhynchus TaxID=3082113 RepID=A0ABN8XTF1_RANTA|nr:unnamed protein product [Rangifer tarandus platyrhynchus]